MKLSKKYMSGLRARMHSEVDVLVDRLLGLMQVHCNHNALNIQENIKEFKGDQVRLRTDIQGIMSENPFLFIDVRTLVLAWLVFRE